MPFKHRYLTLSFLLLSAVVLLLNVFCGNSKQADGNYLNHQDSVKYVGIETCRSCHNDIYQTFIQTGMGQSFELATRAKSAADFSRKHVVYDRFADMYYRPWWKGDSMFVTEFRLQGKDTTYQRSEHVDYIIGSGQHTNSHLMNVNGYVYQLPLTWYAQKGKWDLPPGFEDGRNVRFNRAIGFECMSCHNAMPKMEEHSGNKFVDIPRGIDCERCHGPGELHVQEKLAGKIVDTANGIDYTIVNPGNLPWERQIDVCQRCHLQGNAVLKPGKKFDDFRPGMDLSTVVDIYMPKYKGSEDEFIMASHAQRLQQSKCFLSTASNGKFANAKLTCITCHNPHVSVKVTGKQIFNNACANCHNSSSACTEKESVRLAQQNNCWGCHMPKSGTIDIPHVTVTDHRIRIPLSKQKAKQIKEFAGIYCINNASSDLFTRGKAYLNYFEKFEGEGSSLDSASLFLSGETAIDETDLTTARVHLMYLRSDWNGITRMATSIKKEEETQPWTCYRIGQAYQNQGVLNQAMVWYNRAVVLAPSNLDFINKQGTTCIELNDLQKGISILEHSLLLNPKQPDAWTNLGFAYLKLGQSAKAIECYNKALLLDPDFEQALLNKAGWYHFMGKDVEAKKCLVQILKRNPSNAQVKQLLQQL